MKRIEQHECFGGRQEVWQHTSSSTGTEMKLGVFLPPAALADERCPVLYWLSGLTCTEQNFITKAGAQRYAAGHGVVLVAPDTSPRGEGVADDAAYDLGQGAGFYVNATQQPWAAHFRMYDYVVDELPALVEAHFPVNDRRAISGHSMGGHGALTIALRNPGRYASVSAFSPIVAPSQVPWGQKVLRAYLGDDEAAWLQHDAVALVRAGGTDSGEQGRVQNGGVEGKGAADRDEPNGVSRLPLLVEQGEADDFLQNQLKPELLREACEEVGHPLILNMRQGYDHSYYFVSSFIGEHIAWHAKALKG
ncbi:MAG: S-formylglutathione hydrolase [Lautropia sp.]|nr:S-formylglutathione hydrolase [Lautropia sp.]